MAEESVEYYTDMVKGEVRRRRGKRKRPSRGPYSVEEHNMIRAFDNLLARRTDRRLFHDQTNNAGGEVDGYLGRRIHRASCWMGSL